MFIRKHYKESAKFTKKLDKIKEINTRKGKKGVQQKEGGGRRTNIVFHIYNDGTIIVNTNCKKHVVLLINTVKEHANEYIKKYTHTFMHTYIHAHIHTYTHNTQIHNT